MNYSRAAIIMENNWFLRSHGEQSFFKKKTLMCRVFQLYFDISYVKTQINALEK